MAETTVLSTLRLLSSPLMQEMSKAATKLLVCHASGMDGVPTKIDHIKEVLTTIMPLLRYADRLGHDASVGDWVVKVRCVAQEVEDILEDYAYEAFAGAGGGVLRVMHRIEHAGDKWKTYCRTAHLLESLMPMVDEIRDVYNMVVSSKLLGFQIAVPEPPHGQSCSNHHEISETPKIWGQRAKEMEKVKKWVIMEQQPKKVIIAVHGGGGLGKTTLAKEIYHDADVTRRFKCRAWVSIAMGENFHHLIRSLAIQLLGVEDPEMEIGTDDLIRQISNQVKRKRYLVVFDDFSNISTSWDGIRSVLEGDPNNEGRILVTTREENLAISIATNGRVLPLCPFSMEESWSLFSQRSSWPETNSIGEVEKLARQIVTKCQGLPLAIVAAADMISTQAREKQVLEKSCKTLDIKLHESSSLNILRHGYYELPPCLKHCFLYCTLFPETPPIRRKQLIRLWLAEEFISGEEAAEACLRELIRRNMVQVVEQNDAGRVKSCRLCGDFRALAMEMSSKQKFANDARRVSLRRFVGGSLLNFSRMKLLKVLELRGASITELPEGVFRLFNLRYLGLRETKISVEVFPKEVEQLHRLRTLDLWKTQVSELPRNIVKLQRLQHLLYCGANAGEMKYRNPLWLRGRAAPKGIWDMKNLQTLKTVEATDELVKQLGELRQLRTLAITKVMHEHYIPLMDSLSKMRQLKHLAVKVASKRVIGLETLRAAPIHLRKLLLKGKFVCAPVWFRELRNLTHLYLLDSCCCESPLEVVGSLPNLVVLVMDGAYTGEKLLFQAKWFPRLRKLHLDEMGVRVIAVAKGALPVLEMLLVSRCGSLGREWEGVENLKALQDICVREPTPELWEFLQPLCEELDVNLREI